MLRQFEIAQLLIGIRPTTPWLFRPNRRICLSVLNGRWDNLPGFLRPHSE